MWLAVLQMLGVLCCICIRRNSRGRGLDREQRFRTGKAIAILGASARETPSTTTCRGTVTSPREDASVVAAVALGGEHHKFNVDQPEVR